jgi:hypothetical protein
MKKILILLLALVSTFASAQMTRTLSRYGSDGNLAVYTPPDSIETQDVILYLHGLGERGYTIDQMLSANYGIEKNEIPSLFRLGKVVPYIVICPQLKSDKTAWGRNELIAMFNILDTYKARGYDIHVTGISLGGMGTYAAIQYAYEYNGNKPGYFKTAGAVCGRTATTDYKRFYKTYIKIWHGSNDPTVPVNPDRTLYAALKKIKGDSVEYKEYTGWGHNIWTLSYSLAPRKENSNTTLNGLYVPTIEETYWTWLSRVDPLPIKEDGPAELAEQIYILNGTQGVIDTKNGRYYFNVTK